MQALFLRFVVFFEKRDRPFRNRALFFLLRGRCLTEKAIKSGKNRKKRDYLKREIAMLSCEKTRLKKSIEADFSVKKGEKFNSEVFHPIL
ncbi:hypothetical protein [Zymomonas sp.]|uniref:hypothetical protein n=1 Tax=Zymomonas sp. TaxID=2068624 RepID=UPI0025CC8141|nr:hypothetical protein [Zymomonas sp.]MCA1956525.1 hypothetical protein [Zymomonas sp.]